MADNASVLRRVKLSDCATFQEGYVNPPQGVPEYFGDEVKWLRAVDLNNSFVWETSRRLSRAGFESAGKASLLFEPDTLAISKSGTIGRLGILKDYMCGNRAVINIKVDRARCDNRFIFYSLQIRRNEIEELATGSVQRNLYCSVLGDLEIAIPPLAEQKAIASILGALDDKIELNRRMNATLEAMARALFQSWFVDFDPVRSKLDGRKPEGMDKATAALFPDAFEESEAGQIPTGWRVDILENLTEVQGGFAFKSQDFIGAGAPVIKIKNIGDDHTVDVDDVEYISPDLAQQAEDFQLSDGDVLMAMTGAKVAKFGLLVNRDVRAVLNQRVARFVPRSQLQRPWFVYCSLLDENVLNQIVSRAEGSAQPNVSTAGIKAAQLVCPLPALVDRFNEIVHSLFTLTIKNTRESRTLATLRDTLLPKLLSGELSLASIPKVKA